MAPDPAVAQPFWPSLGAAQSAGGWGAFTAQTFGARAGWGKSFGTIGWAAGSAAETRSQVWRSAWMCGASGTQSDTAACQQTAGSNTAANDGTTGVRLVLAVSLWSKGDTGVATADTIVSGELSIIVTFQGSAWANELQQLTAIPARAAPGAAATLSGVAGAGALAASTATLAALAALY